MSKTWVPWLCKSCCECILPDDDGQGHRKDGWGDRGDSSRPLMSQPSKSGRPAKQRTSGTTVPTWSQSASWFHSDSTPVNTQVESESEASVCSDASGWSTPSNQYCSQASTIVLESLHRAPKSDDLMYNDSTQRLNNVNNNMNRQLSRHYQALASVHGFSSKESLRHSASAVRKPSSRHSHHWAISSQSVNRALLYNTTAIPYVNKQLSSHRY